eukprot:gb/GECH01013877.1/.p1 GENE.gb/GECH01013877.1/~~gb/GECH01013877.1/.p1  ORF type:complete len:277 (+),score=80.03 gb/GECH01013877.1/:1-831(+)
MRFLKKAKAVYTSEGQGAKVYRSIGAVISDLDPFLMLDEFFVKPPAGFPDHPHRGFETVTYMLDGSFKHKDNKGNSGIINQGDVQWMTAGRGVVHSEMPNSKGVNHGMQLWVNLPSSQKMTDPRYQDMRGQDLPSTQDDQGNTFKVIAGDSHGVTSPVKLYVDVKYIDITIKAAQFAKEVVPGEHQGFIYLLSGSGVFGKERTDAKEKEILVFGEDGSTKERDLPIENSSENEDLRCVLVSGKPIKEQVAKYGPFVMNTQEEIMQAFSDFRSGKFT